MATRKRLYRFSAPDAERYAKLLMKQILLAFALLALTSCEENKEFSYQPLKDVGANFRTSYVDSTESDATLVRFKFEFNNNSKKTINFDVSKIKLLVNGKNPLEIHYLGLASNSYSKILLPEGYSKHELNVYLGKEGIREDGVMEFIVVDSGLRENGQSINSE